MEPIRIISGGSRLLLNRVIPRTLLFGSERRLTSTRDAVLFSFYISCKPHFESLPSKALNLQILAVSRAPQLCCSSSPYVEEPFLPFLGTACPQELIDPVKKTNVSRKHVLQESRVANSRTECNSTRPCAEPYVCLSCLSG
jgi:hypothetical protein